MIQIRLAQKGDLPKCAKILKDIYNNNVLNEGWTEESSNAICDFYFKINPDLFFVATRGGEGEIVGFTFSYIKPWADGNQLMLEEIAVDKNFRRQGIATNLLKTLLQTAKNKYAVSYVNGTTYNGENEMPYSWYKKLKFERISDLFLICGDVDQILKKLEK